MLEVSRKVRIPIGEIELSPIRASGPGGQHVNKVASAIHLRFDIGASSLPEECKRRLMALPDRRISRDGVIVIKAQRYREQEQNRRDALERLAALVRKALHQPAKRKATRPSPAARRRRLDEKARRGQVKALRGRIRGTD